MPSQTLTDAAQQARNLAKQVTSETLKVPGEIAAEAKVSFGLAPQEVKELYGTDAVGQKNSSSDDDSRDQQLQEARAKLVGFSQKRKSEWDQADKQALQTEQKRVRQIVEVNLGHTPEGKPKEEVRKEEEKKKGIIGQLSDFFKGKRPRKMLGGLGHAKKQSSAEFSKTQQ